MVILETKSLKKVYGTGDTQVYALRGINVTVQRGEFIAIVGTSGSGKSTFLNIIGGLDIPTSGEVIVDQKNLSKLSDNELTIFRRRKIGFIFQQYNLIPMLTVWENIILPLKLDGNDIDIDYMKEILEILGLKEKKHRMINELSGGQQQRVAIARALAIKPAIVLADEPTGNLDSKASEEILSLLHISNQKYHQTVIVITHDMEIAKEAGRVITIDDGKIIKDERN